MREIKRIKKKQKLLSKKILSKKILDIDLLFLSYARKMALVSSACYMWRRQN